jgi:hypothetical protein
MNNEFYVYIYLDPRKPGEYKYDEYSFNYEPFYVGKGKGNRMYDHINEVRDTYKNNKIQKILSEEYNLENYIIKIEDYMEEQDAFDLEIEMISLIGRLDLETGPLTNLTDGGEGSSGRLNTKETKEKISNSLKGHKVSEETRKKQSKIKKGKEPWNKGKKNSQVAWNKGKKNIYSEETKKKMSEAVKNRVYIRTCQNCQCNFKSKGTATKYCDNCKRIINEEKKILKELKRKESIKNRIYHNICKKCGCEFEAKSPRKKYCKKCKGEQ